MNRVQTDFWISASSLTLLSRQGLPCMGSISPATQVLAAIILEDRLAVTPALGDVVRESFD